MLSTRICLALVLALVGLGKPAAAEITTGDSSAYSHWESPSQSGAGDYTALRRLPRAQEDWAARPPVFTEAPMYQPFFTAQSVVYENTVDLTSDGKHCVAKDACCPPAWAHRCGLFGEYLLLRARDAEVAYAVPINGPIAGPQPAPIQVGPVAMVDPDSSAGFRVGGTFAFDCYSSVAVTYSHFESHTENAVATGGAANTVLRPLVMHPSMFEANTDALAVWAGLGVDFQTVDADYRSILRLGECSVVNWFVGGRYARLQQDFSSLFTLTGEQERVLTDVGFNGGGIRFGLDGERHHRCGLLLYGRGAMSLVAGEFSATYFQGDNVDQEVVQTGWNAGRVVPIMDLELGMGWQSRCSRYRFTVGYNVSYWFNVVTTDQWIQSVQQNDFVGQPDGMSYDTLTFDGLTARAEYRF